jgi:hypothetical protein
MRTEQPTRASSRHSWIGRRLTPWVAGFVVLGLVLGGMSPCLCAGEPARDPSERHACCAHVKTEATRGSTANATLTASSQPCAGSRGALAVEVPPNRGDHVGVSSLAVVTTIDAALAPEGPTGQLVFAAAQHHAPPLLHSVLRI